MIPVDRAAARLSPLTARATDPGAHAVTESARVFGELAFPGFASLMHRERRDDEARHGV